MPAVNEETLFVIARELRAGRGSAFGARFPRLPGAFLAEV